jgi:hypothetical protein
MSGHCAPRGQGRQSGGAPQVPGESEQHAEGNDASPCSPLRRRVRLVAALCRTFPAPVPPPPQPALPSASLLLAALIAPQAAGPPAAGRLCGAGGGRGRSQGPRLARRRHCHAGRGVRRRANGRCGCPRQRRGQGWGGGQRAPRCCAGAGGGGLWRRGHGHGRSCVAGLGTVHWGAGRGGAVGCEGLRGAARCRLALSRKQLAERAGCATTWSGCLMEHPQLVVALCSHQGTCVVVLGWSLSVAPRREGTAPTTCRQSAPAHHRW